MKMDGSVLEDSELRQVVDRSSRPQNPVFSNKSISTFHFQEQGRWNTTITDREVGQSGRWTTSHDNYKRHQTNLLSNYNYTTMAAMPPTTGASLPAMAASPTLTPRVDEHFQHPSGYRFRAFQSAMLESAQADVRADALGVHPQPCMLFDTLLEITNQNDKKILRISTADALGGIRLSWRKGNGIASADGSGVSADAVADARLWSEYALRENCPVEDVECQYAKSWGASRDHGGIKALDTDSDWTFSSTMLPRVKVDGGVKADGRPGEKGEDEGPPPVDDGVVVPFSRLPLVRLTDQSEPILFYTSLTYYEDELDDSGSCTFEVGFFNIVGAFRSPFSASVLFRTSLISSHRRAMDVG